MDDFGKPQVVGVGNDLPKIMVYLASSLPKRIMGKAVVGLGGFNDRSWHIAA